MLIYINVNIYNIYNVNTYKCYIYVCVNKKYVIIYNKNMTVLGLIRSER